MPFIVGLAGSVAVGKSTTARVLQALLARWPSHPRVELLPTDGFLFPNDVLEARGLMNRKGFPESYDLTKLLNFLGEVKSGKEKVEAPVYSHLIYDVLPDQKLSIERPDIVIVEGLNVLQPAKLPKDGEAIPFVSDFFDFSIYIDAAAELVESWYVERFLRLRQTAFRDPASYFHRYATLSEEEAVATGLSMWRTINLVNLNENILPTRQRADLILRKGADHAVETVALRKLEELPDSSAARVELLRAEPDIQSQHGAGGEGVVLAIRVVPPNRHSASPAPRRCTRSRSTATGWCAGRAASGSRARWCR